MKDDVKWGEERFPLKIGNFPALNGARAKISLYSVFPFKILNSLQAGEMWVGTGARKSPPACHPTYKGRVKSCLAGGG